MARKLNLIDQIFEEVPALYLRWAFFILRPFILIGSKFLKTNFLLLNVLYGFKHSHFEQT